MKQRYEYRVEIRRQTLIGDKIDAPKLEKDLNAMAKEGWQLKSMTATEVKGRLGPGGAEGLIMVFERPVG